jgi:hypothetical protein
MLLGRLVVAAMGGAIATVGVIGIVQGDLSGMVGLVIGVPVMVFGFSNPPRGMSFDEYKNKYGSLGDNERGFTPFDKI